LLELIALAQRAQEDISRQFEEVRAYAAPLKLNRAVTSLRELVEEAWDQISAERELRDAELTIHSSEINAKCKVDRFLLVNAIRNILENSLAATDGSIRIQVDFANTDLDNRSAVEVSIRDHGPGLSPEAAERALDAFYTTKTRGTGLGLAIVKRIIEAHGGRISLANADASSGTGTIVSLIIPEAHP
ncbi:MAG TPA: ATP-binding protein, partial [Planctomycetaceae bacterium]|nr:ATP-binding protein [Planctomycetaceae bacterium]